MTSARVRAVHVLTWGGLALAGVLLATAFLERREFAGTSVGFAFYFGLPATACVLCVWGLANRRSSRIALAALSGLLVALLSSNAYIEFYRRRATTEAAQTGARDTRSRVETIAALRDEGRLAYPPFSPWVVYQAHHEDRGGRELHSLFELESREVIPLTNVPRASIVLCNETGQWVVHETDEFGFSNPPDLWARAPVEVAVLGDSYVQGYCVPQGQDLVARIREEIPSTLGLGIGGTGPLSQLAVLREYGARCQPRKLVWCFFENDVEDLLVERCFPLMRAYLRPGFAQRLAEDAGAVAAATSDYLDESLAEAPSRGEPSTWSRILAVLACKPLMSVVERLHARAAVDAEFYELYRAIVLQVKADVESWGGELYVVYLPSWAHYSESAALVDPWRERNRRSVLDVLREAGIPVIDMKEIFERSPDLASYFSGWGNHYSAAGYARVAAEILAGIRGND